ncbi:hypothetical protein CRUP_003936 [Coryphaenoides rupestris]|nr:hypothetical protein CRUP_003936 [Coryphaenoides rupestris]
MAPGRTSLPMTQSRQDPVSPRPSPARTQSPGNQSPHDPVPPGPSPARTQSPQEPVPPGPSPPRIQSRQDPVAPAPSPPRTQSRQDAVAPAPSPPRTQSRQDPVQPGLDLLPMSVESVFIFQEASGGETGAPAYDAIVVEQWTVIDCEKRLLSPLNTAVPGAPPHRMWW